MNPKKLTKEELDQMEFDDMPTDNYPDEPEGVCFSCGDGIDGSPTGCTCNPYPYTS